MRELKLTIKCDSHEYFFQALDTACSAILGIFCLPYCDFAPGDSWSYYLGCPRGTDAPGWPSKGLGTSRVTTRKHGSTHEDQFQASIESLGLLYV